MSGFFRFFLLLIIWLLTRLLFRFRIEWITLPDKDPWSNLRLIAFLHHTSLMEFLFLGALPIKQIWRIANHVVVPVADKTLSRPIVGFFLKQMGPRIVSITRKMDETWDLFLKYLGPEDIILVFPEGRMMRKTGLDKDGKPMSVRGGIADILRRIDDGHMLIAYSGGLHHVQTPGSLGVRLFKTLSIRFEIINIADYKNLNAGHNQAAFKLKVASDLEKRMYTHCPMPTPPPRPRRSESQAKS